MAAGAAPLDQSAQDAPWSAVLPDWPVPRRAIAALTIGGALLLLVLNSLTVVGAHLRPLAGYAPTLAPRGQDSAEYFTWIRAFQTAWAIPDFNAPWQTAARQRIPLMWLAAWVAAHSGWSVGETYLAFQAGTYLLAAWGLLLMLRAFTDSSRQALLALVLAVCTLSWKTFLLAPILIVDRANWMYAGGFFDFLGGASSDGFLQGASGSFTVTFGTASTLLSLWLLARFFASRRRRDLVIAALMIGASGFFHPFEFLAVGVSGAILLLLARDSPLATLTNLAILGLPSVAAAAFYAGPTLGSEWLAIAAGINRQLMLKFPASIIAVGWPPLAALLLIPPSWQILNSAHDRLLQVYVMVVFAGLHLPIAQPQHLVDGLYYAAAILLARELDRLPAMTRLWASAPRRRRTALSLLLAYALAVRVFWGYEAYAAGVSSTRPYVTSARAPVGELAVIAWLRANAQASDLVLAPRPDAAWITSVPIHSFASHWQFSLTYKQQLALADRFFAGQMPDAEADRFLRCYGFRYVVLPVASGAAHYLGAATLRARLDGLAIYEFAGRTMFPLPRLHKVSPGNYDFACPAPAAHRNNVS